METATAGWIEHDVRIERFSMSSRSCRCFEIVSKSKLLEELSSRTRRDVVLEPTFDLAGEGSVFRRSTCSHEKKIPHPECQIVGSTPA